MFYLLLGVNAWTDLKQGCIYDALSAVLFLCAALEAGRDWSNPYFLCSGLVLGILWLWDRGEVYLGRGDYLVLLSVSLYTGWQLPLILIITSGFALAFMGIQRKAAVPLVPFLFLGSIITEFLA